MMGNTAVISNSETLSYANDYVIGKKLDCNAASLFADRNGVTIAVRCSGRSWLEDVRLESKYDIVCTGEYGCCLLSFLEHILPICLDYLD